jgi:hypothetical protein
MDGVNRSLDLRLHGLQGPLRSRVGLGRQIKSKVVLLPTKNCRWLATNAQQPLPITYCHSCLHFTRHCRKALILSRSFSQVCGLMPFMS